MLVQGEPGCYYLGAHETRAKDGYRTPLGGVEIKKSYGSVHVMPAYVHPELLETLSEELRRRMRGKSCFNFRTADPALLAELGELIDRGAARFADEGRLTDPVETLALFVRFWLINNPPLPDTALAAAQAMGKERWERFLETLNRRMEFGPRLRNEISEDREPDP